MTPEGAYPHGRSMALSQEAKQRPRYGLDLVLILKILPYAQAPPT
jgi:hypothetical protein